MELSTAGSFRTAAARTRVERRALNEKMWHVNVSFWEATGVFAVACECSDPNCVETIEITPEAYEEVRRGSWTFVVARSHVGHAEWTTSDGGTYLVVEAPEHPVAAINEKATALEFPSHQFRALVAQLLDVLPADGRERTLHDAGERFGHQLAGRMRLRPERDLASGLEQVCTAVRSLGFHAALEDVSADRAVIAAPTCPLRPLVSQRVEAASIDRGMWTGLVREAIHGLPVREITCETHSCLESGGPCAVILSFR